MPIYEYRCKNGHEFEVMQSMSDPPVDKCEVCGAPVERVFHPVAVHFKGSGFYTTDYGRNRGNAGGSSDLGKKEESKSDAAASKSPEGKSPEGKSPEGKSSESKSSESKSSSDSSTSSTSSDSSSSSSSSSDA